MAIRILAVGMMACLMGSLFDCATGRAEVEGRYKRVISYQSKNDLFYNFYEGPQPSGTAAQMYVAPLPVPIHVGHSYTTYQPLMPHEMMYHHHRSHYAHTPGAGWTRAKIRYGTRGLRLQDMFHDLSNKY
ncbi:MAG: hypothetical protein SH868_11635 [Bythopirellula sp.]|nr:hypothetical protein [Bythopirellula sp.]